MLANETVQEWETHIKTPNEEYERGYLEGYKEAIKEFTMLANEQIDIILRELSTFGDSEN